jgi:hypothetical protein
MILCQVSKRPQKGMLVARNAAHVACPGRGPPRRGQIYPWMLVTEKHGTARS